MVPVRAGEESGGGDAFDTLMLALANRKHFNGRRPPSAMAAAFDSLCTAARRPPPAPLCVAYGRFEQTTG